MACALLINNNKYLQSTFQALGKVLIALHVFLLYDKCPHFMDKETE